MEEKVLINFTNHPSQDWPAFQTEAALAWGDYIIDISFPMVPANAEREDVEKIACDCVERIVALSPTAVLCQGEFTLAFHVILKLKTFGIPIIAACSERNVIVQGSTKITTFNFVRFREY